LEGRGSEKKFNCVHATVRLHLASDTDIKRVLLRAVPEEKTTIVPRDLPGLQVLL